MDFSTGWACVSHASDVLGVCIMITSPLLRTETERWREMCYLSSSEVLSAGFLAGLAWHDIKAMNSALYPHISMAKLPYFVGYPSCFLRVVKVPSHRSDKIGPKWENSHNRMLLNPEPPSRYFLDLDLLNREPWRLLSISPKVVYPAYNYFKSTQPQDTRIRANLLCAKRYCTAEFTGLGFNTDR